MSYARLTPTMALQLAAPHTWPAAVLPVLLSFALTYPALSYPQRTLDFAVTAFILLIICVLLQSAVNTLNDYIDFKKGADTPENQLDPADAVLVYNNVNPKSALNLVIAFIVVAFALGILIIMRAGFVPLVFAIIGVIIIVLYSVGKTPISYLPIGEAVSGITMGGLITLACVFSLIPWAPVSVISVLGVFWFSLPVVLGIALIMMTNNTCDIDKDIEAHRKTLPVLLGKTRARTVYHALLVVWIVLMALNTLGDMYSLFIWVAMMLLVYPSLKALWRNPLSAQTRLQAMPQCLSVNVVFGLGYCLIVYMSMIGGILF